MRQQTSEQVARKANLEQMRGTTSAQLRSALAEKGISPMLTSGAGPEGAEMSTYVAQAAARPSTGSMSMRGIGMV